MTVRGVLNHIQGRLLAGVDVHTSPVPLMGNVFKFGSFAPEQSLTYRSIAVFVLPASHPFTSLSSPSAISLLG